MRRLPDDIFHNSEERNLDKSQIEDYIRYLEELIEGGLPLDKEVAYQAFKLKLIKRLYELNRAQIKFYPDNKQNHIEDKER